MIDFKLSDEFVDSYRDKEVPWGYKDAAGNSLGEITYLRTYSRTKEDGTKETWVDTCRRVIEGMFSIQKRHCRSNHIEWKNDKAQRTAKDAFDRLFNMKWLPAGRGLWAMGSPIVMDDNNSAPLQSCAFVSTENSVVEAMTFLFDASMLGVGVGFDADGAGRFYVSPSSNESRTFVIPDSREGWVESLKLLLEAYLKPAQSPGTVNTPTNIPVPVFDYSEIRPYGEPIKRFGGKASGPGPLKKMHELIQKILERRSGSTITMTDIADIGNIIGTCVVAGNVRRSAEIFFVDSDSEDFSDFLNLKNSKVNPERNDYSTGWGYMCLPEDSWIHTDNGPKRLRDLVGSNFSAALGGRSYPSESSGFFLTSEDREVFTVSTKQGYSVRATSNHPIKTKNGFVNVEDLKAGDKILVASHTNPDWEGSGGTFSEGYLLGAVWGDGTYTLDSQERNRYRASILLYDGGADEEYVKYVEKQAQEIHPNAKFGKATKSGVLQMRNNNITSLVEGYGFAHGKRVTDEIESSSVDFYRGFLRAAFDADGTVAKYRAGVTGGQVILSQSSFSDLQAIQRMLGRLGIYSTIRQATMSEWGKKDPFTLAVSARSLQTFYDLVGFAHSGKAAKLQKIMETKKKTYSQNAPFYAEVADISLSSVESVYDVTISEVHEFDANGIVVHNSNNSVRAKVGEDLTAISDGIKLNGEPGVVWMDVIRKYGRLIDAPDYKDTRVRGLNPCSEQPLEHAETCVSGDTLIPTRLGTYPIQDLVGKDVDIWNGEKWSTVTPFSTGRNSLIRVHLSDGSYLDATPKHKWETRRKTEATFKKRTTNQLEIGMYLPEFDLSASTDEGDEDPLAYTYGWIAGDGFVDGKKAVAIVQTSHADKVMENLEVKAVYPEQNFCQGSSKTFNRVVVDMDFEDARTLRQDDRLPQRVMEFSPASLRKFFGAWVDTDGSVVKQVNTDNFVIYGSEGMLRQAQVLLRRIGVNHASLQRVGNKGDKTNYAIRNKDLYRLYIPSFESGAITTAIKKAERVGSRFAPNNAHLEGQPIDRARKQKIVKLELISEDADTYCFTEPERGMGVFGNVLTYQCNLVEVFINNCEDRDDFIKTLKVAYLYGKTVTLLPTKWEKTNTVMQRNRRIGLSASGVADFADIHGMAELRETLDDGFKYVLKLDNKYSEWLCIRESIRHTTMKPSGSISILAGSSPGTHWTPGGEFFIRRITFSKTDPLFIHLKESGYSHEDFDHDPNSAVILFPVHTQSKRSASDVPAWEKIHLASEIQAWWSDNAVSCTVDFKPEEADQIPTLLAMYDGKLKGISFLPSIDGGAYKHMPYEKIDSKTFETMGLPLTKADFSEAYSGGPEAVGEKFCSSDYCEIEEEVNEAEGDYVSILEIALDSNL